MKKIITKYITITMSLCLMKPMVSVANESTCPVADDVDAMYAYFYHAAYAETGLNDDGRKQGVPRKMNKAKADQAWACIEKAAELNNCSALFLSELYYRYGIDAELYGFMQSTQKADVFKQRHLTLCEKPVESK